MAKLNDGLDALKPNYKQAAASAGVKLTLGEAVVEVNDWIDRLSL